MSLPLRLCLATHNPHKVEELRQLLRLHAPALLQQVELVSLAELGVHEEVVEDGQTYAENSLKKARAAHERTGLWALGDDSGLEVAALGGAPGLYSARYGGKPREGQTADSRNREVLLAALQKVPLAERQGRFVCMLCLYGRTTAASPPLTYLRSGECAGRLLLRERGDGGFGYDPLFVPDQHELKTAGLAARLSEQTFAELSSDEKNRLSHRTRALCALREALAAVAMGHPLPGDPSPLGTAGHPT
jgi:XTP/dITP diphosphohydrolase